MILDIPAKHYADPVKRWPPLTPFDPRWGLWAEMHRTQAELFAWSWGHLTPKLQDHYLAIFRRHEKGLKPPLDHALVEQIAEALMDNWDLFGPVLEIILKRTKQERKRRK